MHGKPTAHRMSWKVSREEPSLRDDWLGARAAQHVLVAQCLHDGTGPVEFVLRQISQGLHQDVVSPLLLGMLGEVLGGTGIVESGKV